MSARLSAGYWREFCRRLFSFFQSVHSSSDAAAEVGAMHFAHVRPSLTPKDETNTLRRRKENRSFRPTDEEVFVVVVAVVGWLYLPCTLAPQRLCSRA